MNTSFYELRHHGVAHDENPPGRGSGRYPYGSGKRPRQDLEGDENHSTPRKKTRRERRQEKKGRKHALIDYRAMHDMARFGGLITRKEKREMLKSAGIKKKRTSIWAEQEGYFRRHPEVFPSRTNDAIAKKGGMKVSQEYADAYRDEINRLIKSGDQRLREYFDEINKYTMLRTSKKRKG